jgi:hypothetical protein
MSADGSTWTRGETLGEVLEPHRFVDQEYLGLDPRAANPGRGSSRPPVHTGPISTDNQPVNRGILPNTSSDPKGTLREDEKVMWSRITGEGARMLCELPRRVSRCLVWRAELVEEGRRQVRGLLSTLH